MPLKKDLLDFLNEKQRKYDYSLVPETFLYRDKVPVICHKHNGLGEEHGVFYASFGHLKRGDGCPKCNGKYMTKEDFIAKAREVHGDKYGYDQFVFVNKKTKGIIHCKKHDLDFSQTPAKHLAGQGCPKCRYEKSSDSKSHDNEWFITKAKQIHGDKYDYSKAQYDRGKKKVEIICHEKDSDGKEHGAFYMSPFNHVHATHPQGCPKCARIRVAEKRRLTREEFIAKAKEVQSNKYDYSKVDYKNNHTKVCIICRKHGEFWQEPDNHLLGQNCPNCARTASQGEKEVLDFCRSIFGKEQVLHRVKGHLRNGKEMDIYIPSKNIAIEYDAQFRPWTL